MNNIDKKNIKRICERANRICTALNDFEDLEECDDVYATNLEQVFTLLGSLVNRIRDFKSECESKSDVAIAFKCGADQVLSLSEAVDRLRSAIVEHDGDADDDDSDFDDEKAPRGSIKHILWVLEYCAERIENWENEDDEGGDEKGEDSDTDDDKSDQDRERYDHDDETESESECA